VRKSLGVESLLPNRTIFKIENLVLWVRSKVNGFASEDCRLFWSTGVLEHC
jgi:hypothetical protein